jgi:predicted nucleic acid-binding protein
MIVVDCTTIAYLLIPCEHTADVEALLKKYPDWASVALWEAEFASVLSKYERAGKISPEKCLQLCESAHAILGNTAFNVPLYRVLEVARRTKCSTYDSYYVALAEDLGTQLYTYDKEVLANCKHVAVKP